MKKNLFLNYIYKSCIAYENIRIVLLHLKTINFFTIKKSVLEQSWNQS